MSKNVSDKIVEMLVNAGVKRIYAITGDSLNPINDAVRRDGRLQWVHVRHEESAAYAASMEAELTGIGCCMGSSGPGHVHLINGLYDANRSGNPVIAIASTVVTANLGTDYFQETNVTKLFDDCSKYCFMANTPVQALRSLQTGIQTALSKRGVAVIGLPGDVAAADAEAIFTSEINYKTDFVLRPSTSQLDQLAGLLNSHKKIMLYCGYGSKNAIEEVMALAKKLQAPIGYSFRGKIFFDKLENEYAVGLNGLLGTKAGFQSMHDADVVVMLGSDFPYSNFLPEKNVLIQIDHQPERIGRRGKIDYGYCGNIKDTLQSLLPLIEAKDDDSFVKEMRTLHQKQEEVYQSYVSAKGSEDNIHPEYVASLINDFASDDAILTVDTGMSAVWAAKYIKGKRNRYLTGSFNHGSMANAMPMSIGAAFSAPQRQTIALCGDGGISMLLGDLMTISQYKLPVKVIVFNNRTLGMVKLEMEVAGLPAWQTDMDNPDFAKIAEAMRIKAWTVESPNEVEPTLKQAFAHDGPVLINIMTDPNALAMPPKMEFAQVKGFAETMGKLMINGQTAEVVDIAKSSLKYLKEIL
ncbi:MAG: thiamine pyrophosphate protein domain protein TPP-binding [Chitinophagaceae bacterium]|nr:thiamine pyrophosphate protein domain protein TPP-binding [Chitinophagaceae bacterium]